jgi:predicted nucleic acid-binding protein
VPEVFADTFYWIALINPADQWHHDAKVFSQANEQTSLVTTEAVLTEVLNYFSEAGEVKRQAAAAICDHAMNHASTVVLPQTREVFAGGFDLYLYKARPDKGYSLTDCISMIEMQGRNITDVLTHDRHFGQEGFNLLLP